MPYQLDGGDRKPTTKLKIKVKPEAITVGRPRGGGEDEHREPRPRDLRSHRLRCEGDLREDRTAAAPSGRLRATPSVGRVQPRPFDGLPDRADPGARCHRPGGTRERPWVGAGERGDRRDAEGGLPRAGRCGPDRRGQAGTRGRFAEPVTGSDARTHRRHRHRDDPAGADRASDEPPLRCRTGPSHHEEVRPRVRAHPQCRSPGGRRVHRDDPGTVGGLVVRQSLGSRRLERPPLAARLRLPDRRDRVRVPVEPASSPTRVVLAGDRRPRVGHLRAYRDDGAQRLLPAQLDVRSDLRTARRVRGPAAVDHAELDRPPVRGRRRRAARSRTCRGPLATTTDRVRRPASAGPRPDARSQPATVSAS